MSQLQEKCSGLQQKLKQLEHVNSTLQKNLGEAQSRHKSDSDEREVRESFLFVENNQDCIELLVPCTPGPSCSKGG